MIEDLRSLVWMLVGGVASLLVLQSALGAVL
jgi:hypothetical protein